MRDYPPVAVQGAVAAVLVYRSRLNKRKAKERASAEAPESPVWPAASKRGKRCSACCCTLHVAVWCTLPIHAGPVAGDLAAAKGAEEVLRGP